MKKLAYHFIKVLIAIQNALYNNYITYTTTGMQDSDSYVRERQTKQDYLKSEIVDKGYNTTDFAQFLVEQRGKLQQESLKSRQWHRY